VEWRGGRRGSGVKEKGADKIENLMWTTVITDVKHNRLSHTSTQVGSYLFILGGHNGQSYAQDVLLFNLGTFSSLLALPFFQIKPSINRRREGAEKEKREREREKGRADNSNPTMGI
jgi:hypothetical protein